MPTSDESFPKKVTKWLIPVRLLVAILVGIATLVVAIKTGVLPKLLPKGEDKAGGGASAMIQPTVPSSDGPLQPKAPPPSASGKVWGKGRAALGDVKVSVGEVTQTVFTDDNGYFKIVFGAGSQGQEFKLKFEKGKYRTVTQTVTAPVSGLEIFMETEAVDNMPPAEPKPNIRPVCELSAGVLDIHVNQCRRSSDRVTCDLSILSRAANDRRVIFYGDITTLYDSNSHSFPASEVGLADHYGKNSELKLLAGSKTDGRVMFPRIPEALQEIRQLELGIQVDGIRAPACRAIPIVN